MLCAEPWSKCCRGNLFLKRIYQATDDKEADKARGSFPADDAAMNLIYRAISSFEKTGRAVIEWGCSRQPVSYLKLRAVQRESRETRMS